MRAAIAAALLVVTGSAAIAQTPTTAPPTLATLVQTAPRTTSTNDGVRGDPLNVALVGTREEVCAAFIAAGWYPADPITLRSSVGIAVSVALNIPYPEAPLSNLYLWCRPQDLAFELPCGHSARKRHHVRLWCSGVGADGRPLWLAAETFNVKVGVSRRTRRPTHHIDPDVDRARAKLIGDLDQAGQLLEWSLIRWTEPTQSENGEGDCYFTDGNMAVGILRPRLAPGCMPAAGKDAGPTTPGFPP